MPTIKKSSEAFEVGKLLDPDSSDSPISHIFDQIQKRNQLQITLNDALSQMGLGQFAEEVFIGEITLMGEVKLITHRAGIVSKLKNKLPSLLNFLRESGFPLKSIQLKVSPKPTSVPTLNKDTKEVLTPFISKPSHKSAWTDLLQDIDHHSPVHQAVKNLIKKIN